MTRVAPAAVALVLVLALPFVARSRRVGPATHAAAETLVILTPHNAFNTAEAVDRKAKQTIQQIEHFLAHKWFLWPVP